MRLLKYAQCVLCMQVRTCGRNPAAATGKGDGVIRTEGAEGSMGIGIFGKQDCSQEMQPLWSVDVTVYLTEGITLFLEYLAISNTKINCVLAVGYFILC